MYRFVDHMGPEEVEAIAAQAFLEMLESGFTRVGEFHYVHHDPEGAPYADVAELAVRIAAAAAETGIGLTLLPVFYRRMPASAAKPPRPASAASSTTSSVTGG
jgi:formimidoylglutamate deiminase